jgi:type IV pilus assembly protein PilZ
MPTARPFTQPAWRDLHSSDVTRFALWWVARSATIDPVQAQPIELRVQYKRLNSFFADYAKNIRRGRTFIATDRLLDVGTDFVFKLEVPGVPDGLTLRGKVQWVVTADSPRSETGMGIGFVFESDADRQRMDAMVEGLMTQSLGRSLYEKLVGQPLDREASEAGAAAPLR